VAGSTSSQTRPSSGVATGQAYHRGDRISEFRGRPLGRGRGARRLAARPGRPEGHRSLALARRFIVLEMSPGHLLGLAAVTLVLGVSCWLIRERDDRLDALSQERRAS
jgi:hypothetical protein